MEAGFRLIDCERLNVTIREGSANLTEVLEESEGKLKQPIPTRADIQKVDRVKSKVSAADWIYPDFLFIANLIRALTDARKQSEVSRRHLLLGAKTKKQQRHQQQHSSSA
ncbi:hypothetical protein L3X38_030556 [Prunus dulcis]|uniref:Uncharacterized protein n=1 Tax=Prunus dulcis TaxID=3755 RepID=A0AAD4VAK4_PRUDU|nr:hypothetical protein L3X38_030556 [Prunus dulcis]